jgi:hypothetical protein
LRDQFGGQLFQGLQLDKIQPYIIQEGKAEKAVQFNVMVIIIISVFENMLVTLLEFLVFFC